MMKWVYYLYFLACSITLSKAQGTDEGCITCAVGKFFETGLEDWILPTAAGVLQFFVPDSSPDSSPAPDAIPNETDNQGTNNNPGSVNQPDIEIQTIASPDDQKCDPNGAGVSVIPRFAGRFNMLTNLTTFLSIVGNALRSSNSSDSLATSRLLWRRSPGQPNLE